MALDYTRARVNGTDPYNLVNSLAFLFGETKLSDASYFKSSLYVQATDELNSRPLSFYKLGDKYGYTTTNHSYDSLGDPYVINYDGVD